MSSLLERFETTELFLRLMLSWSPEKITKRCSYYALSESKYFDFSPTVLRVARPLKLIVVVACRYTMLYPRFFYLSILVSRPVSWSGFGEIEPVASFSRGKRFSYTSSVLWFHTFKVVLQGLSTIGLYSTTWSPIKECLGLAFLTSDAMIKNLP